MRTIVSLLAALLSLAVPPVLAVEGATAVASVTTKSALAELEERQEGGLVFVVVTNTSAGPIEVERVRPFHATFLRVEPQLEGLAFSSRAAGDLSIAVPPGHSQALPFQVSAKSAVEPGEQMVLWQVEVSWQQNGRERRGNLVTESRFKVAVLGESEVLDAFKVPSLLLLPGVLFLLTWRGLQSLGLKFPPPGKTAPQTEEEPEDPKKPLLDLLRPRSAAAAVLFSLAVSFSYPTLTGLRGEPRDLLVRYGLEDIYNVCFLSVLLGLTWFGLTWSWKKTSTWWKARRTPSETDTPLTTLRKLARRGVGSVTLEQVQLRNGNDPKYAFLLLRQDDQVWVAPPMKLEWKTGHSGFLQDRLEELLEDGRMDETASFFEQSGEVALLWHADGGCQSGPRQVKAADVLQPVAPRRIIEV